MGNLCSFCYLCGKEFDLFALEPHECESIEDEDSFVNATTNEQWEQAIKEQEKEEKSNVETTNILTKENREAESVKCESDHITINLAGNYREAEGEKNKIGVIANKNGAQTQSRNNYVNYFESGNDRGNNGVSLKKTTTESVNIISVISVPRTDSIYVSIEDSHCSRFDKGGKPDTKPRNKTVPSINSLETEIKQDKTDENACSNLPSNVYPNESQRSNESTIPPESGNIEITSSKTNKVIPKSHEINRLLSTDGHTTELNQVKNDKANSNIINERSFSSITSRDKSKAASTNNVKETKYKNDQGITKICNSNADKIQRVSTRTMVQDSSAESKPQISSTNPLVKEATKNIGNVTNNIKIEKVDSTPRPSGQFVRINSAEKDFEPIIIPLDKSNVTVDIKKELIKMTEKIVNSNIFIDLTEEDLTPVVLDEDNSMKVCEKSENFSGSLNIVPDNKPTASVDKCDIDIKYSEDGRNCDQIARSEKMVNSNMSIDLTKEDLSPDVLDGDNSMEVCHKTQNFNGNVDVVPNKKPTAPVDKCDIDIKHLEDGRNSDQIASTAKGNSTPPLYCEFCGNVSSCLFELTVHKDFIHENHYFDCFACGELFKNTNKLVFHYKLKHERSSVRWSELDSFKYYCSQCGQGFNYIHMLLDHKKQLIESKKHVLEKKLNAIFIDGENYSLVEAERTSLKSDDSSNIVSDEDDRNEYVSEDTNDCQEVFINSELSRGPGFQAGDKCNVSSDNRIHLEKRQSPYRKKLYVCSVCARHFKTTKFLVLHYRIRHNMTVSSTSITPSTKKPPKERNSQQISTNAMVENTHGKIEGKSHISINLEKQRSIIKKTKRKSSSRNSSENFLDQTQNSSQKQTGDIVQKTTNGESKECKKEKHNKLSENTKSKENQEMNKKRKRSTHTNIPENTKGKSNSNSKKHYSKESLFDHSTSTRSYEPGPPRKKTKSEYSSKDRGELNKPRLKENAKVENGTKFSDKSVACHDQNTYKTANKSSIDDKVTTPICDVLKEGKINSLPETQDESSKYHSNSGNEKANETFSKRNSSDKYREKCSKAASVPKSKIDEASGIAKTNVPLKDSLGSRKDKDRIKLFDQPESANQDVGGNENAISNGVGGMIKSCVSVTSFRKYLNKGEKSILLSDKDEECVSYAQYKMMRSSRLSSNTNIGNRDPNGDAAVLPNKVASRAVGTLSERRFSSEDSYAIQRGHDSHPRPLQRRRASLHIAQEDLGAAEFSDEPETDEETPQEWESSEFCEVCGMKAANFETLRDHMEEVHHGFKFKCFVCDMGFDNIDTLIKHQSKYSKSVLSAAESKFLRQRKCLPNQLNPYYCGFCGLGFTLIDLFIRHKQDKHTKRRGMKNNKESAKVKEFCSKEANDETASEIDSLKTVNGNNTEINPEETRICSEMSKMLLEKFGFTLNAQSSNESSRSPEATKFIEFCELCGEKYLSFEDKQKHFHLQSFKCVICRSTFENLKLLSDHYDLCHQKNEILNFEMTEVSIGKSFKYYCRFCGMGFYFINQVLAHKEVQHYELGNHSTENKSTEIENNTVSVVKETTSLSQIFAKPKVIPGLDSDSAVDQQDSNEESSGLCPASNKQRETNFISGDLTTVSSKNPDRLMDLHEYLQQNNVPIINETMEGSGGTDETNISSSTVTSNKWIEAADQLTNILNEDNFMEDLNMENEDTQPAMNKSNTDALKKTSDSNQVFCEACGDCFKSDEGVSIHRINTHGKFTFRCSFCSWRFQNISSLIIHQDNHSEFSREKRSFDKGKGDKEIRDHFKYYCSRCGKGHKDINDMKKHRNSPNCSKTGSIASGLDEPLVQRKSKKKILISCPNCSENFSYFYQMNEHRVKGCSARDHDNIATTSQSSREVVSSNNNFKTLNSSRRDDHTSQCRSSKNNQKNELKHDQASDVECTVSTTTGGDADNLSTGAKKNKSIDTFTYRNRDFFLRRCDCGEIFVTERNWDEHIGRCKIARLKEETIACPASSTKKVACPAPPNKKVACPVPPNKKSANPGPPNKKSANPAPPNKKFACPVCPNKNFASKTGYQCHVKDSKKHQKFLEQSSLSRTSSASAAPMHTGTEHPVEHATILTQFSELSSSNANVSASSVNRVEPQALSLKPQAERSRRRSVENLKLLESESSNCKAEEANNNSGGVNSASTPARNTAMYQCCKCQANFNKLQLLTQHIVEKCVIKISPMKKFGEEEDKSFKANLFTKLNTFIKRPIGSLTTLSVNEQLKKKNIKKEEEEESIHSKKEVVEEQNLTSLINEEELQCSKTLKTDDCFDHKKTNLNNSSKTIGDDLPEEISALSQIYKTTDNDFPEQNDVAKGEGGTENVVVDTDDNFKPAPGDEETLSLDNEKELQSAIEIEGNTSKTSGTPISAQPLDCNKTLGSESKVGANNKVQFANGSYPKTNDNYQHIDEKIDADLSDINNSVNDTPNSNLKELENQVSIAGEPQRSVDNVALPSDMIKVERDDEPKCTRQEIVEGHIKENTRLEQIVRSEENVSDIIVATAATTTTTNTEELQHTKNLPNVEKEILIAENISATNARNEDIANDTPRCENNANKVISSEKHITEIPKPFTVPTLKACNFCNESFSYNFQLKKHKFKDCKLFLAYKKKYSPSLASKNICKKCSLKFTNASALKMHMLVYCKLYKHQKISIRTIRKNKRKKSQIKKIKKKNRSSGKASPNKEADIEQSTNKTDKKLGSDCIPQQSALPEQNDDARKKTFANYCAKHCICDICFSSFFNFAALTTHKKYYCKRFGDASSLNKSSKKGKDASQSNTQENAKTLKHEADDNGKINIKSSSLYTDTGKEDVNNYFVRDYDDETIIRVYTYGNSKSSHGIENKGLKNVDVIEKSGNAKKRSDSPATERNSSNEKRESSAEPLKKICCDECGNVFQYLCDLFSHKDRCCSKMKSVKQNSVSEQTSLNKNIIIKTNKNEDVQNVVQRNKLQKKKLFICPYCNGGYTTESDLSTHKMLYCKEINKKTLLALNLDQQDTQVVKNMSKDAMSENAKVMHTSSSASEVLSGKSTKKTAEKSEPKLHDNNQPSQIVCHICGSEFYYQTALEMHQSKYCKVFTFPKAKNTKNLNEDSMSTSEPNKGNTPKNLKAIKGEVDELVYVKHKTASNNKIVSPEKQNIRNEEPNTPLREDTSESTNLKTTFPESEDLAQSMIKKQEKGAEKVGVSIKDDTTENDVKRPKSPVTAPVKDPEEEKNICNICGSRFEYSFALHKHKTLYCKSFVSPKSGNAGNIAEVTKCVDKTLLNSKDISKECSGNSSNCSDTKDSSKIMINESKDLGKTTTNGNSSINTIDDKLDVKVNEGNILMAKEQAAKEKVEKKKTKSKEAVESGDFKCQICNATFKYEVDLSWHKYKSKYKSCAENTGTFADDIRQNQMTQINNAKSREKSKETNVCKSYSLDSVSNTSDKNVNLNADANKIQKQVKQYNSKVEDELDKSKRSGILNSKDTYKSRPDEDNRRGIIPFDLRHTLTRKSQSGSETKRRRSRSFERDAMNLPSTSRSHETKISKATSFHSRKQLTPEGKRHESDIMFSSRERSAEKMELSSSREHESKYTVSKRKRPSYEIMEADSSSDKRKKAPDRTNTKVIVKKSSSRKKASDSDDSLDEIVTPSSSVSRVYNKVSSYKRLEPLKPSIFCEQCGTSLNNAAEVRKPTCGHHRTTFPCAVCKSYFPNINTLIRHQDEEHQTDEVILKEMEKADKHTMVKYFCCICGIDFNFIKNLIYHKVTEHKFFHRMFSKDGTAPIVRPVNSNIEGFACVFCDQMLFSSLKDLFDHEDKSKRHKKNEKKFKSMKSNYNPVEQQRFINICYICNLGFVSFRDQQIHMLESPEHYKLEKKCSDISKEDLLRLDKTLAKYSEMKSKYLHEEAKTKKSVSFPSSSRPLLLETERDKFHRKHFSDFPSTDVQSNDLYRKVASILNYDADSFVSSSKIDQHFSFKGNFSAGSLSLPYKSYSQKSEVTRSQSPESMIPIIDLSSASNYQEAYPGPSVSNSSFKPLGISENPVHMQHYQHNSELVRPYYGNGQINTDQKDNYADQIDLTGDNFGIFKEEKSETGSNQLLKRNCEAVASDEEVEIVKTYQCYICSENFESLDHLDKHSCAGPF